MAVCNICGNDEFKPGPLGRLTPFGTPPLCSKCGSVERHRTFRAIFDRIRDRGFATASCLQFSNDVSVARGWFERHEISTFGGPNTLDIQKIERGDASYDIVISCHVLEHVRDYRAAIKELVRITKPEGFLFLAFPDPVRRRETEDWGYPKPEEHGHYRIFGRDVERTFGEVVPDAHVIVIEDTDPVTGLADLAYILTRSDRWLSRILERDSKARICQVRDKREAQSSRRPSYSQERPFAASPLASRRRTWYLVSLCNVGRITSRYSVAAVSERLDDFCWLDLGGAINPENDIGITGLAATGSGEVYAAVQSSEPRLLQLSADLRVVRSIPLTGMREPRSLAVENARLLVVGTDSDDAPLINAVTPDGGVEEVHLSLGEKGERLRIAGIACGPDGPIVSVENPSTAPATNPARAGSVLDARSGSLLIPDVYEPNSLAFHDGVVQVLSSASGEYLRRRGEGPCRRHYIGGYLRGLCIDEQRILIGRSARRPASQTQNAVRLATAEDSVADLSHRAAILTVSPRTGKVDSVDFSLLGSEIFDIVKLPGGIAPARMLSDPVHRRVASMREAQSRLEEELGTGQRVSTTGRVSMAKRSQSGPRAPGLTRAVARMAQDPPPLSAAALEYLNVDVPSVNVARKSVNTDRHRTRTFRELLDHIITPGKRLVDLGAGPCIFSRIARDRGFEVTAVDVRDVRVPSRDELGTIQFVQSDVRDFGLDDYDVIVILGLLYHLTLDDQKSLLSRASRAPIVIVETQVHMPELIDPTPALKWQQEIVFEDGYEGILYPENDNAMASAGNQTSFWHTEESLTRLFANSGFNNIKIIDPVYRSVYGARRFYLLAAEESLRIA